MGYLAFDVEFLLTTVKMKFLIEFLLWNICKHYNKKTNLEAVFVFFHKDVRLKILSASLLERYQRVSIVSIARTSKMSSSMSRRKQRGCLQKISKIFVGNISKFKCKWCETRIIMNTETISVSSTFKSVTAVINSTLSGMWTS